jgi:hypothetical protein
MAYADIPPSMRPALSEFDPTGLGTFQEAVQAAVAETGPLPPTLSAALPAIKAKEVEAVRNVLSECMRRLRQMSQSLRKRVGARWRLAVEVFSKRLVLQHAAHWAILWRP